MLRGGRRRRKKNDVSVAPVCLSSSADCINCVSVLFVTFLLFCLQTLSPSTAPVSHSRPLSLPLRLSSCHSHFPPTAPGPAGLPLKSRLLWLWLAVCVCVCVTRVSRRSWVFMATHEHSATPFEWPSPGTQRPAAHWPPSRPMRGGLSLGQVDVTTEDYYTGCSSEEELYTEMWRVGYWLLILFSA